MFNKISKSITNVISQYSNLNERELAYFNYGLQALLGTILEFLILLLIAYLLSVFYPVLIAIISFLILRPHAGGIHLPTYILCMSFSIVIFLILGFIAKFAVISTSGLLVWLIIVFNFSLYMIKKYAPADTNTIPIKDPSRRETLKNKSVIIISIWIIVSILTTLLTNEFNNIIIASSLGILTEVLGMHPFIFNLCEKYLTEHN
ncbi:MAG: accessory gene regulator ArgB-like protein [bacterium]